MILCIVDDLLFSTKISTAGKALGVDVAFERAADRVLDRVRAERPEMVIFDLNSRRLRPLETIAAIKADAELRAIRTMGFVSHVDSQTIAAAHEAGADDVMARSAFSQHLGEILTGVR